MQAVIDLLIGTHSYGKIMFTESTIDMVNNALGALIFISLPTMISNYFIKELKAYHNKVYDRDDFLEFQVLTPAYQSVHFVV